jgi:alkanesulfonate monooxygenase SsuD/methylene tetrahydromethanopterin reductase-like flavin-dependent oxidoreductase (luciferase family)
VTTGLGLGIMSYSYPTGVTELFDTVIRQAQEAESAGFDTHFLQDRFYRMPFLGGIEAPMLESYTALGALAAVTEKIQLGTLVNSNTFRNPTLLAKAITTLDVMSHGRAILGIGLPAITSPRAHSPNHLLAVEHELNHRPRMVLQHR